MINPLITHKQLWFESSVGGIYHFAFFLIIPFSRSGRAILFHLLFLLVVLLLVIFLIFLCASVVVSFVFCFAFFPKPPSGAKPSPPWAPNKDPRGRQTKTPAGTSITTTTTTTTTTDNYYYNYCILPNHLLFASCSRDLFSVFTIIITINWQNLYNSPGRGHTEGGRVWLAIKLNPLIAG